MFNQIAPSWRITYLVAQRISLVAFVAKCKKWANAPKLGESNHLFTLTKIHKCNFKIKGSEYFWNWKSKKFRKENLTACIQIFSSVITNLWKSRSLINFLSSWLSESLTIAWFCDCISWRQPCELIRSINLFWVTCYAVCKSTLPKLNALTEFIYYLFIYYGFTPLHYKRIMKWNKLTLL